MTAFISQPLELIIYIVSLVTAITVHEFAHALTADRLGDPTPRLQGRLTLNPLAHLDPWGTLMLVFFRFGWGRPVLFDPFNLRDPRRDAAVISLAGPLSNMIVALAASLLIKLLSLDFIAAISPVPIIALNGGLLLALLQALVEINVILAVFNLIPVHPLDGFKIVGGLLTQNQAREWNMLERYGMVILLFLILPVFGPVSLIHRLISPPINFIIGWLLAQPPLI